MIVDGTAGYIFLYVVFVCLSSVAYLCLKKCIHGSKEDDSGAPPSGYCRNEASRTWVFFINSQAQTKARALKMINYFWWWCPSVRTYTTHRSKSKTIFQAIALVGAWAWIIERLKSCKMFSVGFLLFSLVYIKISAA